MKKLFFTTLLLTIVISGLGLLVLNKAQSVSAHHNDDDGYGACVSTGPQCGTDNGTQSKVVSVNPSFTCPSGYQYQNSGNFSQRCHRIFSCNFYPQGHCPTEHVTPGVTCSEGYDKSGSNENTQCTKTLTRDCHTGTIDNSACEVTDVCPNLEGVQATVPDGYHTESTGGEFPQVVCVQDEVSSTPPEATPSADQPKGDDTGDYHPSTPHANINLCNGVYPDKPIIKVEEYKKTGTTSAHFGFWPSLNADSYVVEYGYSKDNLPYGIPFLPKTSTGFDANGLKPGFTFLFARVTAKLGECYTSSDVAN